MYCWFISPLFLPTSDDMIKTTLLITWLLPVGVAIIPYSIQFKYKTLPLVEWLLIFLL